MATREALQHARTMKQQLQELLPGRTAPDMLRTTAALSRWAHERGAAEADEPLPPALHRCMAASWFVESSPVAEVTEARVPTHHGSILLPVFPLPQPFISYLLTPTPPLRSVLQELVPLLADVSAALLPLASGPVPLEVGQQMLVASCCGLLSTLLKLCENGLQLGERDALRLLTAASLPLGLSLDGKTAAGLTPELEALISSCCEAVLSAVNASGDRPLLPPRACIAARRTTLRPQALATWLSQVAAVQPMLGACDFVYGVGWGGPTARVAACEQLQVARRCGSSLRTWRAPPHFAGHPSRPSTLPCCPACQAYGNCPVLAATFYIPPTRSATCQACPPWCLHQCKRRLLVWQLKL